MEIWQTVPASNTLQRYMHHLRGKLLYYHFVIELKIIEKNSNRPAIC